MTASCILKYNVCGFLCIIGATLIHLSFGYNYTTGNMNPYLIEYMMIKPSEALWFHAVILSGQAVSMPIGGILYSKIGFRPVVIIGSLLCSGGVLLSRLTIHYGLGPFIVTYAVMFGLGMGLPYALLFTVASAWFPNHRALITGIILSGLGMGAIIFTPMQTALINPNNKPFNSSEVSERVPNSFLYLGGLMLALQFVGILMITENKMTKDLDEKINEDINSFTNSEKIDNENYNESVDIIDEHKIDKSVEEQYSYAIIEAVKCIDFYFIAFIIFLNGIPINLLSSTYKIYGKDYQLEDSFLSPVATCTAIFNCGGRIIWGLLCDRFSFKLPLGWLLIQWALLFSTFPFLHFSSAFKVLYPIWVFCLFFTMSGHFVLMPGTTSRIFGSNNIATIYGLLYLTTAPSSLFLTAIVSQFHINDKFTEVYMSCAAVCLIGFVLSLFLKDDNDTLSGISSVCGNICNRWRVKPVHTEIEGVENLQNSPSTTSKTFSF